MVTRSSHVRISGVSDDAVPHRGEDRIGWIAGADEFVAWVIDGATGLAGRTANDRGETPACAYARLISENVSDMAPAEGSDLRHSVWEAIRRANADFEETFGKPDQPFDTVSASLITAKGQRGPTHWQVDIVTAGDCLGHIVNGANEHHVPSTLGDDFDRPFEDLARDLHSAEPLVTITARDELSRLLRQRRALMNATGGYKIVAPNARSDCLVHLALQLAPPAQLVLMTDGAARFVDKHELGSWYDAVRLIDARGPHHLIASVRERERDDALHGRVTTVKLQDDASIVHCSLN